MTSLPTIPDLAQTDLRLDLDAAAVALVAVGVDPDASELRDVLVLASADILLAVSIAHALPTNAQFEPALRVLRSLSAPQPVEALEAQDRVLAGLRELALTGGALAPALPAASEAGAPPAALVRDRLDRLAKLVTAALISARASERELLAT